MAEAKNKGLEMVQRLQDEHNKQRVEVAPKRTEDEGETDDLRKPAGDEGKIHAVRQERKNLRPQTGH